MMAAMGKTNKYILPRETAGTGGCGLGSPSARVHQRIPRRTQLLHRHYNYRYGCYVRDLVNLALTATASASARSSNSRKPVMANDGKADTRWEASNSSKGSGCA